MLIFPNTRMVSMCSLLAGCLSLFSIAHAAPPERLELRPGDHISIVGNTLADRMQHDGYLETLLQTRFPDHKLVIRNLGFSGDELTTRLRSSDFGSPDDWLARNQTNVVFAFFGYNESFGGSDGLSKFRQDLENFIKQTRSQKYDGASSPRIVLFSPIAHENLNDANLPTGSENNARLAEYTQAMNEVARANDVLFVDLYHPSLEMYAGDKTFTFNGIHLTDAGNAAIAQVIDQRLFQTPHPADAALQAKTREAVLDKNFHWFHRYRTTDGFSVYGGRSHLKFVDGQTNREVAQREMEILDEMTALRDERIWAVAKGGELKVDDTKTQDFIPVVTNKPGKGPNGEHEFLSGGDAIELMTVADGYKVELFASEEDFPELINPVQMAFDTRGRLWVAAWPNYPHWKPKDQMNDKLLILEDTDGDGRADKSTTFADNLNNPTGFEFWGGGVLVAMMPELVFLQDTDGDDKADIQRSVLHGLDSADTHHQANSFVLDPGGALYFQEGTFHQTQVESPYRKPIRSSNAGVFRYEPRTQKFESYVAFGFANPHGHVFDRWGMDIIHDGTGAVPYHGSLFSSYMEWPQKHSRPPTVYHQRTRPCPGTEILSSSHFPEENQGNLLVGNVIGFQGILQYRIDAEGASLKGTEVEPLVSSSDPNFRPSDFEIGPDGALYFTDWQNPIIGHMQHNLRDPSRDRIHGRVYRLRHAERPLLTPVPIAGEPVPALLELLKSPDNRVRYRAKIELSARPTNEVIPALQKWLSSIDKQDPTQIHHRLEGLWVHEYFNTVNLPLLEELLSCSDFRARAAAVRVLRDWIDRVPNALDLLRGLATDEHPRVRMEAVRASSFLTDPAALEVALIAEEQPRDEYLDYMFGEVRKVLVPQWESAVSRGEKVAVKSDAGARYYLQTVSLEELLQMPASRAVNLELLFRPGVPDEQRLAAINGLARDEGISELQVLLNAIRSLDTQQRSQSTVFDLVRLLTMQDRQDLSGVRDQLVAMSHNALLPLVRQIGYVATIAADGSVDRTWQEASSSITTLKDLIAAMPLVQDPSVRAQMYSKVLPLLDGLPPSLAPAGGSFSKGTYGRFVRVDLPGKQRTLTLAEVEVISDGRNIARQGKASQSATSNGGDASRAIDGNSNPSWGAGGQTHTPENKPDPWWELDLGGEFPIESIIVYNRADGLHSRLQGFTLSILDSGRNPVFTKTDIPAPNTKEAFEVGGGGTEGIIRRVAMDALVSVRGKEAENFRKLSEFVVSGTDRSSAIRAIQRIPRRDWVVDLAPGLADQLLEYIATIPEQDRTSMNALDALQFADALASLTPDDKARQIRSRLGELGVKVIRIATVPHQMVYDRERVAVQAGKPVEFIFENPDIQPHNFIIIQPGSMVEIGELGESTGRQPDAAARHFVPRSNKILLSSELLQARGSQKLSYVAPTKPGVYPYVCTYPGHWRRMYGALYVVEDLAAYEADPEGYAKAHGLEPQDDLLKFNRPRKEWTLEDLAGEVEPMLDQRGRDFGNGKQIFTVANCVACHRLNDVGLVIGQDLSKLDQAKMPPLEVLKHILDPSLRIDDKFATNVIALNSGKVVSGMVLEESDTEIKMIENPLAKTEPVIIKKSDIDEREKSKTSIMPKGLLDKLTHSEILDLIAYVYSRGQEDDPVFGAAQ